MSFYSFSRNPPTILASEKDLKKALANHITVTEKYNLLAREAFRVTLDENISTEVKSQYAQLCAKLASEAFTNAGITKHSPLWIRITQKGN